MTTEIEKLLGSQVLQHNKSGEKEFSQVPTNELNGKLIGLYFSLVYLLINLK